MLHPPLVRDEDLLDLSSRLVALHDASQLVPHVDIALVAADGGAGGSAYGGADRRLHDPRGDFVLARSAPSGDLDADDRDLRVSVVRYKSFARTEPCSDICGTERVEGSPRGRRTWRADGRGNECGSASAAGSRDPASRRALKAGPAAARAAPSTARAQP